MKYFVVTQYDKYLVRADNQGEAMDRFSAVQPYIGDGDTVQHWSGSYGPVGVIDADTIGDALVKAGRNQMRAMQGDEKRMPAFESETPDAQK
jgi:hypothetical protein